MAPTVSDTKCEETSQVLDHIIKALENTNIQPSVHNKAAEAKVW